MKLHTLCLLLFGLMVTGQSRAANLQGARVDSGGGVASSATYQLQVSTIGRQNTGQTLSSSQAFLMSSLSLFNSDLDDDEIPDRNDADIDGDGLDNQSEESLGTDRYNVDSDSDGLSDYAEVNRDGDPGNYTLGVDYDPLDDDTDDDGVIDGLDFKPLDPEISAETVAVPLLPLPAYLLFIIVVGLSGMRFSSAKQWSTTEQ